MSTQAKQDDQDVCTRAAEAVVDAVERRRLDARFVESLAGVQPRAEERAQLLRLANEIRPTTPFIQGVVHRVGAEFNVPFELLIKQLTSNYPALLREPINGAREIISVDIRGGSDAGAIGLLKAQIGDVFRHAHIVRRAVDRLDDSVTELSPYAAEDSEIALLRDAALTLRRTAEAIDIILEYVDEPTVGTLGAIKINPVVELDGTMAKGVVSFTADGPSNAQSCRYAMSTAAFPEDAVTALNGTLLGGRAWNVTNAVAIDLGQTIHITIVPFTEPGGNGAQLPAIHLQVAHMTGEDFKSTRKAS